MSVDLTMHIMNTVCKTRGKQFPYSEDVIERKWAMFVQRIHAALVRTNVAYKKSQKGVRQDRQCLFGVMHGNLVFRVGERELWLVKDVQLVSEACLKK